MDIVGKARRLESTIARTLDSATRNLVGTDVRDPLEIVHDVVDAVERQVQPAGRGTHVFPFNKIRISVLAASRGARARLEAVFDGQPTLHERIAERLRAAGCQVADLTLKTAYVPRRETGWSAADFDLQFARVPPSVQAPAVAAPGRIELTVAHGTAHRKTQSFTQERIDLGRCVEVRNHRNRLIRTNDVAFTDGAGESNDSVSRRHAHIIRRPDTGDYRVYDDESTHGTSIVRKGRTIAVPSGSRGIRLQSEDEIVLGEARLRVKIF